MTVRAPASARVGQVAVGEVGERVGAEQDERVDARRRRRPGGCRRCRGRGSAGTRRPRAGEPVAAVVEGDPAGQQARGQAHVEGAVDVGPAQRREERTSGRAADAGRRRRRRWRRPTRRATARPSTTVSGPVDRGRAAARAASTASAATPRDVAVGAGRATQGPDQLAGLAGTVEQRDLGQSATARWRAGRDSMTVAPSFDDGVAEPQEQDRQLLLGVGAEHEHGAAGAADLVDGGPGQAEHDLGREAVAELGVDVVGAEHALGQLGPGVGGLVGEAGAADARRSTGRPDVEAPRRCASAAWPSGIGPAGRHERRRRCARAGRARRSSAVDGLEAEAALVAQPAPVDRVDVDARRSAGPRCARTAIEMRQPTEQPWQVDSVVSRSHGPGLEAVGSRGERADRADLHGVAAEVRGERLVGEGVDLGVVAPVDEVDQRVAGHVLGEPGAAVAEDAALTVEEHQVADRDRLLVVALLLDEAALARAVGHGLVLERALAALVADRAVERVVDEEELEDAVLGLLGDRGLGVDLHVRRCTRACSSAAAPGRGRCRPRRGTCGTCPPASCAGGSRSAGCRRRCARRRR